MLNTLWWMAKLESYFPFFLRRRSEVADPGVPKRQLKLYSRYRAGTFGPDGTSRPRAVTVSIRRHRTCGKPK
jgi:hypothetical protein